MQSHSLSLRGRKMKIKYLLADLDNTFLRRDKSIPKENMDALERAKKSGIKVIISSGRSNMSLDLYAKQLGLDYEGNYIIAYNGCLIYEAASKKVLCEELLDTETAKKISDIVTKIIPDTLCYCDSRLYTENITNVTERYAKNSSLILNHTDKLSGTMKNKVQKIIMIGRHEDLYGAYEEVIKKLGANVKAEMYYSSNDLFEFASKGKNKGTGLVRLAEILNEPLSHFAAVGDNQNDIEMIEYAGVGIAVSNAESGCKNAADYITEKSCDEGGFAEAVDYLLGIQ